MEIDLSDCSPQREGGMNSRTFAGAYIAYKALTVPLDPVNEGSFRALKVIIPEGSIMMARLAAPMSGWRLTVPLAFVPIVRALAEALADPAPAGHNVRYSAEGGSLVVQHKTRSLIVLLRLNGSDWG